MSWLCEPIAAILLALGLPCHKRSRRPTLPALATATVSSQLAGHVTVIAMEFLTIREAANRTGHSTHKIRRLIKAIATDPSHTDRSHIEPSPSDVERLTADDVQFTWRVTEELVRRELGDPVAVDSASRSATGGVGESGNVMVLLQRAMAAKEQAEARLFDQLKTKDEQIAGLQQTVASLNERLRESNLLMANVQKQLPSPKAEAKTDATSANRPRWQNTKPPAAAAPPKKPKSASLLRMLFG